MEFYTARTLFGLGLILSFVGFFTSLIDSGVVSLLGMVLTVVGAYFIAELYKRSDIFYNMLYAVVTAFVGVIIVVIAVAGAALAAISSGLSFASVAGLFLTAWLLLWAVAIVTAHFEKKAYLALFEVSGRGEFRDVARFVWWGALLMVVLVGVVLLLVSLILAALGAFKLERPTSL